MAERALQRDSAVILVFVCIAPFVWIYCAIM